MSKQTDVLVIGAGPGGYAAAIRLAQLGRKALVVERERIGGICLNWGCMPVKALLHAAEIVRNASEARPMGIVFAPPQVDVLNLYGWKGRVVDRLVRGVEFLLKSNGVEVLRGSARFTAPNRVSVTQPDGTETGIEAGALVVATGSKPAVLAGLEPDGRQVIDSNGALNLVELPRRIAIIGAGVIGLEFATMFRRLGSEVTVLELVNQVLPGTDVEAAAMLQRVMAREGIVFHLGVKVAGLERGEACRVTFSGAQGEAAVEADKVLVAVGRAPLTDGLGLEAAGIACDARGFIQTDARYRTNVRDVYAVGDVRGGPLLAHKAMAEALAAAESIAGGKPSKPRAIPACVYTDPALATVGSTEAEAAQEGRRVRVSRVPVSAIGRALTLGRSDGMCKLVVDEASDRVLGATIVAPQADALIAEAAVAVELGLCARDIGRVVHPHPTMSELLFEAAEAIHGRAIHVVNR